VGVNYIKVNWFTNNNSTYTYYLVEASSISYSQPEISSDWLLNTTFYSLSLSPNTSYYIRLKSKNEINVESSYVQLPATWTKIQPVTGIDFIEVNQTSVTLSALGGPFSNLNKAFSGISFSIYKDSSYTQLYSSTSYLPVTQTTFTSLSPNTTY
jgi:hypothetical protein